MNENEINYPPHYTFSKHEPISVIRACGLNFSLGNCIKYIARAGRKDPTKAITDLQKAAWYLNEEIETRMKEVNGENNG